MKVKAIIRFRDLEADRIREAGEEFTVSDSRFEALSKKKFVEKVVSLKKEAAE